MPDYSYADQPHFLQMLFYPRPDFTPPPAYAFDLLAETGDKVKVAARFYSKSEQWPWILYFHGNGEVAADYDDLACLYLEQNINLVVADYRGYGLSGGTPSFTRLIADAHLLYEAIKNELEKRNYRSDLFVMGRSLGSISALELACHYQETLRGLIIESGFSSINRLIYHLGIDKPNKSLDTIENECLKMIASIKIPALVIHGESDVLVLPEEGQRVYNALGSQDKEILIIPRAGHNDIIVRDIPKYFGAVKSFIEKGRR